MTRNITLTIAIFSLVMLISCSDEPMATDYDYMEFESGGKSYSFTNKADASWNYYHVSECEQQVLGLSMQDSRAEMKLSIGLVTYDLWHKPTPFTIDKQSDPFSDGQATVSLFNLKGRPDDIFGEQEDDALFDSALSNVVLTVNSFYDNTLSGTFQAVLKTKTREYVSIEKGTFRIKVAKD